MILADTSIWIMHLSTPDHPLATELMKNNISIHSIVVGELACGSFSHRKTTLAALNDLPHVIGVQHNDVMQFIEHSMLYSLDVGYSDFHLLAATRLGQAQGAVDGRQSIEPIGCRAKCGTSALAKHQRIVALMLVCLLQALNRMLCCCSFTVPVRLPPQIHQVRY